MKKNCLTFDNFSLGYQSRPIIANLSGQIDEGDLVGIVGANGCGKSTLMKGIANLLSPITGRCTLNSALSIAYLPQQSELNLDFPARVIDLVFLGLWKSKGLLKRYTRTDKDLVYDALEQVGLAGFEKQKLNSLSGGQLQRALFARIIVQHADLILLDEPFNSIDNKTISDMISIIEKWNQEGKTILAVLHDIDLVKQFFPKTLLISNNNIVFGSTENIFTDSNLYHAFYN